MAVGHQPGQSRATRPRIVIESPFAANLDYTVAENAALARNICRSCVLGGGNPIASHLLYTQFLDDQNHNERAAGIECGLDWSRFADEAWFVLRHGGVLSRGMKQALLRHISLGKTLRFFRTYNEGRTLVETLAFEEVLDDTETGPYFRSKEAIFQETFEEPEEAGSQQKEVQDAVDAANAVEGESQAYNGPRAEDYGPPDPGVGDRGAES